MIFTNCVKCDEPFVVGYEAGDKGAGGVAVIECDECNYENYVELVSFCGETLSKEEFFKKHPNAKKEES